MTDLPPRRTVAQMWSELGRPGHDDLLWEAYLNPPGPGYYFVVENVGQDLTEAPGVWVAVNSQDLPCPVRLRLRRGRGGRVAITGMVLGERGEREITSETLRAIRLTELTEALFAWFDVDAPPEKPDRETWVGKPEDFVIEREGWFRYNLFKDLVYDAAAPLAEAATESGELEQFAKTYLRHLAAQPRRAMTATAKELSMSRATANRRAAECRRRGLLPTTNGEAS